MTRASVALLAATTVLVLLTGGAAAAAASPTSSTVSCAPKTTRLTYHKKFVVTAGGRFRLSFHDKVHVPHDLPTLRTIHASSPGLGSGSGLTHLLDKHWTTLAYAPGTSSQKVAARDHGTFTNDRHGTSNFAVFLSTKVLTGRFSSMCGGKPVSGHYRTFSSLTDAIVGCKDKITDHLSRVGHRRFCR